MNAREWKEKTRKVVTLKSGLVVTVRRMSPWAVSELGPVPGMEIIPEGDQSRVAKSILLAGVVSPKFGDGDDEISLLDLDAEDTRILIDAIVGIDAGNREGGLPLESTASPAVPQ